MPKIRIDAKATSFYISLVPAMPEVVLTAVVEGAPVPPGTTYAWYFSLEYPRFLPVKGGTARNVVAKTHPAMAVVRGNPATVPFAALMCGRLTARVEVTIAGQCFQGMRDDILIGGTNPTTADLQSAIALPIIRKMVQQESGGKQFSDTAAAAWSAQAINPNWSGDNLRGVGLGQLTNPAPADADMWNWRVNAQHLQQRFSAKRSSGTTLHTRMIASPRFIAEAKALNDWRKAEGQPPLTVRLPALTADQQDLEGLRAYNGFGRKVANQYLAYIHEFEPATTRLTSATRKGPDGKPLTSPRVPLVDANGLGSWSQISGTERKSRSGGTAPGDPDYVAHVVAQRG